MKSMKGVVTTTALQDKERSPCRMQTRFNCFGFLLNCVMKNSIFQSTLRILGQLKLKRNMLPLTQNKMSLLLYLDVTLSYFHKRSFTTKFIHINASSNNIV